VAVGLDNDFELCPGNLARWSADLDAIDQHLLVSAEAEVTKLFFFEDKESLFESCSNMTGCYHERPAGPENVEPFSELDGRAVYWFVFDRLEIGWSASLPPFIRHGLAAALTNPSCDPGSASLSAVLNKGPVEGLALPESSAAGQWARSILEHAGPERFQEFASKLDDASSEAFIRSVFAEVYGLPMEVTWDDAHSGPLLPPPGGWCRAPALPFFDGHSQLSETLDCSGERTQAHADGSFHVDYELALPEGGALVFGGELPEGVELRIEACACAESVNGQAVELDEVVSLSPGSWRLRLSAGQALPQPVDLQITVGEL
jgi:hypothetical protein